MAAKPDYYAQVADLPLTVEAVDRTQYERETASGFTRVTTEIVLSGEGVTGRGEDVTYDDADHDQFEDVSLPLAGEWTMASVSDAIDDLTLFPEPPEHEPSRQYRRWALESAALDLGLRQADTSLGNTIGRDYAPVRFVVSPSVRGEDDEPTAAPVRDFLARDPGLEFKLDPTPAWSQALIDELAATDAVRTLDLKGYYEGTDVDNPPDPDLYARVLEGFPNAIVEDPLVSAETEPVLAPHTDRLSWDYPITGIQSIRDLPFEPTWLNCKPSRFGSVESLLDTIAYCEANDIRLYGGGQFELGVGRSQIQALASLCYPDAPNDVAPGAYNDPDPGPDLPGSPLPVPSDPVGFGAH